MTEYLENKENQLKEKGMVNLENNNYFINASKLYNQSKYEVAIYSEIDCNRIPEPINYNDDEDLPTFNNINEVFNYIESFEW